jgi:hypothetical protein
MKMCSTLALALAAATLTVSAVADTTTAAAPTAAPNAAQHAAAVTARQAKIAQAKADTLRALHTRAAAAADASQPKSLGSNTYPGLPSLNPVRAYPPSCASYPLPDAPSGPSSEVYSTIMPFYTRDVAGQVHNPEQVGVTVWRVACSTGGSVTPYNSTGQFYNAITFMRIDRSAANEGNTDVFPTFPFLALAQDPVAVTDNAAIVRAASEPNTWVDDGLYDSPIFNSTTYVLENELRADANGNVDLTYNHQYSDAFTLYVDPYLSDANPGIVTLPINAYAPTRTTYPDAFNPLPITGYMTTSWFAPDHGGEGMTIQVYDNGPSDPNNRTLAAGWYASDSTGRPFWLFIQATMPAGATSVQAQAYYTSGGGFAGSQGNATTLPWGTVTFSFPDCNHVNFTYNGQTDATTAGPGGSGTRSWIRVANEDGLACE